MRAYARSRRERGLTGGSHTAVRKAIDGGRLVHSVQRRGTRYFIDPRLADEEWEDQTDPVAQTTEASGPESRDTNGQQLIPGVELERPGPSAFASAREEDQKAVLSIKKSQSVRLAYQARLAQLEFERKSGQLERKVDVRMEAGRCGAAVKQALKNMPARLADILAAETDRNAIEDMLDREVDSVLEELTRVRTTGLDE